MQLDVNKLSFSVDKGLAAVYLITGDEPLQQGEVVDLIRKKANLANQKYWQNRYTGSV